MWIFKGVALIRGGHLFEAQHLLEKIQYANQKKETVDTLFTVTVAWST